VGSLLVIGSDESGRHSISIDELAGDKHAYLRLHQYW